MSRDLAQELLNRIRQEAASARMIMQNMAARGLDASVEMWELTAIKMEQILIDFGQARDE